MKKKYSFSVTVIGYATASSIGMLTFHWYNWLSFKPVLPYWQWYILAFIYIVCVINTALQKPFAFITSLMFLCACIVQLLYWFGIITLPLFK